MCSSDLVGLAPFPAEYQNMARLFGVRSLVFEVIVTCELNGETRQYRALIRRNNQRDLQTLLFHQL